MQDVPYDIRALLGMTDDSAAGTVSKSTAAQQMPSDVSRALLGWDTQAPGANSRAAPAVGEANGFNIQDVPSDIRALLGWEGKNAVENGPAAGYNNNWKNTAEASARDSLADNPLLLTGKYGKYRDSSDSTYPDLPLPPGLQDDASVFAYLDTQKAYEAARAEMEQSGDLLTEGAGDVSRYFKDEQLKTEPNAAYFWSGNSNGIGGKDFAMDHAAKNGGTKVL